MNASSNDERKQIIEGAGLPMPTKEEIKNAQSLADVAGAGNTMTVHHGRHQHRRRRSPERCATGRRRRALRPTSWRPPQSAPPRPDRSTSPASSVPPVPPLDEERRQGEAPRFATADDTWRLVEPYLLDYGITRVAHLTHLDHVGIPVHMAMKPSGRTLSSGSGKGITELGSTLSAVDGSDRADVLGGRRARDA